MKHSRIKIPAEFKHAKFNTLIEKFKYQILLTRYMCRQLLVSYSLVLQERSIP